MGDDRDEAWDADRNGIPDSIQRDPVVVPADPVPISLFATDPGLPGIDSPIEPTAAVPAEPIPEPPVAPAEPPPDASEAVWAAYEEKLRQYEQLLQMHSNLLQMHHEMQKSIIQNFRT